MRMPFTTGQMHSGLAYETADLATLGTHVAALKTPDVRLHRNLKRAVALRGGAVAR